MRFGGVAAVDGLSLAIPPGGRLALLGGSGSGKSVTALAVAGLLPPEARALGRIAWPALGGRRPRPGGDVGVVFQDPTASLDPVLDVGEQVGEALVAHEGLGRREARAAAAELLARVGVEAPVTAYPHELSGGQRQRVAIAMAVAARPRLLIADEPTTALDAAVRAGVVRLLDALAAETGMALLLVTHDLALAAALATEAVVLREGRAVEAGPLAAILRAPRHAYTRRLVDADRPPARPPTRPAPDGPPLLAAAGLARTFRGRRGRAAVRAVDDVALEVRRGEVVALVGGSGSGKTTLSRLLLRLLEPDAGSIVFAGRDLLASGAADLRRERRHLQVVFQDPLSSLNPRATVARLLADPLRVHRLVRRRERPAAVAALLRRVGLDEGLASRLPHELSGGQRQRVAIARAVATAPELLVLDEPVAALDPPTRAAILDLLLGLREASGLALLLISHDLALVRAVADRVLVMERGRIVEAGSVEAVLTSPGSAAARALVAAMPPPLAPG